MNFLDSKIIVSDIASLEIELNRFNIDTSLWGIGDAKSINNLFTELEKNDCILVNLNGILHRVVSALSVLIIRDNLVLMEKEQILPDNRIRIRNLPLAEKITLDETPIDPNIRAINEELAFIGEPNNNMLPISHTFEILTDTLKCITNPKTITIIS